MKENQVCHVCWMYIYMAYSIGSKSSAYRKIIVVARYIWIQMNVAKKIINSSCMSADSFLIIILWKEAWVSTMENYQCSQAVIVHLCIISYRWLNNSIMSMIISIVDWFACDIVLIFLFFFLQLSTTLTTLMTLLSQNWTRWTSISLSILMKGNKGLIINFLL